MVNEFGTESRPSNGMRKQNIILALCRSCNSEQTLLDSVKLSRFLNWSDKIYIILKGFFFALFFALLTFYEFNYEITTREPFSFKPQIMHINKERLEKIVRRAN